MSSVSDFSDDSSEDQLCCFLDLPPEIRNMVYEAYLPQTVTVGKEDDPELAILSTCHQVYQEAVPILKKRSACHLIIRGPESYQRARSWIDQSGDRSTSTIRTLDIDSWTEFSRIGKDASFRQYRFSFAFKVELPGFSVKYTCPGDATVINYNYPQYCLNGRQDLPSYLFKVMKRLLGKVQDGPVGTDAWKDILETIASYSKWIHVGQNEHHDAPEIQLLADWRGPDSPERTGWVHIFPDRVHSHFYRIAHPLKC